MDSRKKLFGQRLAQTRNIKGLSQRKLSALIGIRGPTIAAYETEEVWPSVPTLIALATVLEVSTDWLLGIADASSTGGDDLD